MTLRLIEKLTTIPLWVHATATVGAFAAFQGVKSVLDKSYAASLHPVDYVTGQTSFNGETIKGYYAVMQDAGTLDAYRTTQIIDFGFLAAMACFGILLATLVARFSHPGSWGRRLGLFAGLAALAGASCDAIENAWSFVMLSDPVGFADWLALPYSGFAVTKFALITAAMLLVLLSLVFLVIGRSLKDSRLG